MWSSQLDLRTLHTEHALLLGIFTLLMVINALAHRGERGTRAFPIYTFAAFLGAVGILLHGSIPEILSVSLSCALFSAAYLFLHVALARFFHRYPPFCGLQVVLVSIATAVSLPLPWLAPHLRLAAFSLALALQLAITLACLVPEIVASAASIQWATGLMAATLALLSLTNLFRASTLLVRGASASFLNGSHQLALTMLLTSVLQCTAIIAFVWMTAARLHEELHTEATTDPLTRLLNRRALNSWAEREITSSRSNGWPLSAILVDLDHFKQINDACGHLGGDAVLCAVATLLAASIRPGDQIGRLGGDEFVILLPRTPEEIALGIGDRLRQRLDELRVPHNAQELAVHASFGVAELGGLGLTWEQLLQRCDTAMYTAKSLGGNQALLR